MRLHSEFFAQVLSHVNLLEFFFSGAVNFYIPCSTNSNCPGILAAGAGNYFDSMKPAKGGALENSCLLVSGFIV